MRNKILSSFLCLGMTAVFAVSVQGYPFTAALSSTQVVPMNSSAGHGSCRVFLNDDGWGYVYLDVNCEFSGLSGGLIDADVRYGASGQNGDTSVCYEGRTVTVTLPNNGSGRTTITGCRIFDGWPVIEKKFYVALQTANYPEGEVRGQIKPITLDSDVNGEGQAEISVFRPSDGLSYAYCDLTNGGIIRPIDWRSETDSTPFLVDFDSDGIADWAYVRTDPVHGSMSTRYQSSRSGQIWGEQIGNASFGDIPVFGDYDGDGDIEPGVFRTATGTWWINGGPHWNENWGVATDKPCSGDYDADGKTDLCVVRVEDGHFAWYIRRSYMGETVIQWGLPTDTLYLQSHVNVDGDLTNDPLVSRDEDGKRVFYARRSSDGSMFVLQWGLSTDKVKLGDYDNDGKTDFVAIREIDGHLVWFIHRSSDGQMRVFNWGLPGDM